jgi:phage terminase large subunit-like protein
MDRRKAIALANAIARVKRVRKDAPLETFIPYGWQADFFDAGARYLHRMIKAGNRTGKTRTAGTEVAYHVTGNYPPSWKGYRFDAPILWWCLGVSGEQIRGVLQKLLFGELEKTGFSGGLIRRDQIVDVVPAIGIPRLAKDVRIRHASGGASTISLKSYSQGQHVLMGDEIDGAWIDEEPQDPTIFPQVVTRTATGNKKRGGIIIITETPELGETELIRTFTENRGPQMHLTEATWDDAPHMNAEARAACLAAYPEYQREMREKGAIMYGHGLIYMVAEERIKCDPIPIPDHWARIAAMDFGGGSHPTTCVWLAHDRDADVIYVTDVYSHIEDNPPVHASAIRHRKACPIVYPPDGDAEKGAGMTIADAYRTAGLTMDLQFHNPDGTKFVEPGITEVHTRSREGRLKVFRSCDEWFREYRKYHRKDGKIVKVDDDLMDATRYGVQMIQYAKETLPETPAEEDPELGYEHYNTGWMAG